MDTHGAQMVRLAGGESSMGSVDGLAYPDDGEGRVRMVSLDPFWLDRCAVSNQAFARFVESTGHVTEAEHFGVSFVFGGLLPDSFPPDPGRGRGPVVARGGRGGLATARGPRFRPGGP